MYKQTITFGDVLLEPQYSDIVSRKQISLATPLDYELNLEIPIIASPMDTVSEWEMAAAMSKLGGMAVIHRYNTIAEQAAEVEDALDTPNCSVVGAAVGVSGDFIERAIECYASGAKVICIDVAHGDHSLVSEAIDSLRRELGMNVHIMAGNVATLEGFNRLADWGADSIRVGIGGGSICSTRIQTGHGVPTLQSIIDCAQTDRSAILIADGGIKNSGDIVKALAAGADAVMLGSLLAGTDETPSETFRNRDGRCFKAYRGMASAEAQKAWRGKTSSLEGVSTTIPCKGSVYNVVEELLTGVRSGFSYSGARDIVELQSKATFIRQSHNAAVESSTHILHR
ncbi:MAG: guanosine monophosphate reductase [Phycisphaerae bacterium]|nr:guanosine monophosphate reductase [Phycisphaerae bacterium]